MTHLYFEDAEVGTTCKAGPYLVSKDEVIQFAKRYDPVPRHIDEEAAARSIFGGLTASSAHTVAVFIALTTKLQPRLHVLAGMGYDELRLPNPVRPGGERKWLVGGQHREQADPEVKSGKTVEVGCAEIPRHKFGESGVTTRVTSTHLAAYVITCTNTIR